MQATFQTADGTALTGQDYVAASGNVVFAPGVTGRTIEVLLVADLEPEGDEGFALLVSSASAAISAGSFPATVRDDDGPTGLYTINPCRLFDTREDGWPVPANGSRSFAAANVCGVPLDAKGVVLNVTVVGSTHPGHLSLYPAGATLPPTSILNFKAGAVKGAGSLFVTLGQDGRVAVHSVMPPASGTVHVVVDVSGYFK